MTSTTPTAHILPDSTSTDSARRGTVIVLAGATAAGKSDVAARLTEGIIVSADSVQAYRGLQIGANKPTAKERAVTPHLLVDVITDSSMEYNAAEWTKDAHYCIRSLLRLETTATASLSQNEERREYLEFEINQARRIRGVTNQQPITPIIVGGTMMYVQWLVHGKPDAMRPTKSASSKATQRIAHYQNQDDWRGAVEEVIGMGDKFKQRANKIAAGDWYRLGRIMEVAFTVQELKDNMNDGNGNDSDEVINNLYSGERAGGLLESNDYDVRCFFLCPDDRMEHSKLVDERCERMIQRGLIPETTDLALSGALPYMAQRAIGYRQTLDYLNREGAKMNDVDAFVQYLTEFTAASRQYSKRQMQWFRKEKDFVFIPMHMSQDKETRIHMATKEIQRMVQLSRNDFDRLERLNDSGISATTRRENEMQGRAMRVYQFRRKILVDGSQALRNAVQQSDDCTNQYQAKRARHGN